MRKLYRLILVTFLVASWAAHGQITFGSLNGPSGGYVSVVEATTTGVLFAVSNYQLYKSTDSGGGWSAVNVPSGTSAILGMYIDPANKIYLLGKTRLWKSTDEGVNWTMLTPGGTFNPSNGKILKNTTTGSLFLVGDTGAEAYGLQRSQDDGQTWTNVYTSDQVNDFVIKNTGSFSHIYLATNGLGGLLKSTNDGGIWATSNTGIASSSPMDMAFNPSNGVLYVTVNSSVGAYYSNDEGANWNSLGANGTITFNGDQRIFASKTHDDVFISSNSSIYTSTSSTAGPWTLLAGGLINYDLPQCLLADGTNRVVGFSREGIQLSTNSGSSWGYADNGIYQLQVSDLSVTPNSAVLVAASSSTVWRQSGNSWNRSVVNAACAGCAISSFITLTNGNILAIGTKTYVSTDDGQTFPTLKSNSPSGINLSRAVMVPGDNAKIYALDGSNNFNNVYFTSNQGTTWTLVNITGTFGAIAAGDRRVDKLSVTSTNDLVLAVYNQALSQYRIHKVPSGSTTAALLTVPGFTQYRAGQAFGSNIYIFGRDGSNQDMLAISADGGTNWTFKSGVDINDIHVLDDEIIFGRDDNSVVFTNDAGTTWNLAFSLGSNQYLQAAALSSSKYAYLGVSMSHALVSNAPVNLPAAPANFRNIALGNTQVALQWDYSTYTDYFEIERQGPTDPDYVKISTTNDLDGSRRYYYDNTAQPNTTYNYRMYAKNAAGVRYSSTLNVTTKTACALTLPDNRSWTGTIGLNLPSTSIAIRKLNDQVYTISDLAAGVSFTDVSSPILGYIYQNCTEPYIFGDNDLQPNGNGTWNSATNTLTLKWQVDIEDKPGATTPAQTITLVLNAIDPTSLAAPAGVSAYIYSGTSVRVQWTAGNFHSRFTIQRSTASDFSSNLTTLGTVDYPTTNFIDNGPLVAGTSYYYRVGAQNTSLLPASPVYSSSTVQVVFNTPRFVLANNVVSNTQANSPTFAWGDIDDDNDEDLFVNGFLFGVVGAEPASLLFENDGTGDFIAHTDRIPAYNGISSALGDMNNDGELDLVFSKFVENGTRVLFENTGNLTFAEVPTADFAGLQLEGVSPAGWLDVDNDGDLDLFTIGDGRHLYLNDGDGNLTEAPVAGNPILEDTDDSEEFAVADYDKDGDSDLLVLPGDNGGAGVIKLFRNNGSGIFSDANIAAFNAEPGDYVTTAWGDYDNDQDLDVFIGSYEGANLLFRNDGNNTFSKIAATAGTPTESKSHSTYGCAWGDVDNDGDLDLITGNVAVANSFYLNTGTGWQKVQYEMIVSQAAFNAGIGFADYDRDGRLDVLAGRFPALQGEGAPQPSPLSINLFKNSVSNSNDYLEVKLQGNESNRQAIGALVKVVTPTKTYLRTVSSHSGFGGQSGQILHFGLGVAATVTSVQVQWPSGIEQTYSNPGKNQLLTIVEDGTGPVITTHSPAIDATGVSINTDIEFTLNESSTAVSSKNLVVTREGASTPLATLLVTSATKTDNSFKFTLPAPLDAGTKYNVTIDAGAFKDMFGNNSLAVSGWSFTTSAGPEVASLSPAHNATNISSNTKLAITFAGVTEATAGKLITLYRGAETSPAVTLDAGAATLNVNTQEFTLPANLSTESLYRVVVEAGAFVDLDGSPFDGIADGQWSFTTVAGPKISTLTPADEAQTVNANATLAIEFDKAVTPVAGKKLKVFVSGSTDALMEVTLADGTASSANKKYTYTLAQKLPNATDLEVVVDPLSFADAGGNLFSGLGAAGWNFHTVAGPAISAFTPVVGKQNVEVDASIVLTFEKNITAVAGKKIQVLDGPSSVILDADVSTTGTVATNKYTLSAPTGGWPYEKTLAVHLDAGAFVDASLNDAAGLSGVEYTFKTIDAPDTQAPVITFTPPTSYNKGFGTQTVSVEITDNKGVESAKLIYRGVSGTTFTEVAGEGKANNRWEFSVPEASFDANGLQYYITAIDASDNEARHPANGYHTVSLRYTQPIEVTTALGFGGTKSDWKIFAMPFENTGSITAVFDELESKTVKEGYRILTYNSTPAPSGSWTDYPSFTSFTRGQGYFVNIKDPGQVTLAAGLTSPANTRDNLFKINLRQGWNQIGNPYLTEISWSDVAAYNNLTGQAAELKVYNGTSYVNGTALAAFTGGFVFAPSAINDLSIPFKGQTSGGRLQEVVFAGGDWQLPLILKQGETTNPFAGIGMHRDAATSFDDLDRVHAPRFMDFTEVSFSHPEHFAGRFAMDVVATQPEFTWAFDVETSQTGMATLQWSSLPASGEFYLFDETLQQPVNMREVDHYSFDPKQSSKFKIYYGDRALERLQPTRVVLGNSFPNPTESIANIPFSLPERNTTFGVRMDVFDMMGRKINTLVEGELPAGFYHAAWTANESSADGLYTVRLSVSANGETEIITDKIMLKK